MVEVNPQTLGKISFLLGGAGFGAILWYASNFPQKELDIILLLMGFGALGLLAYGAYLLFIKKYPSLTVPPVLGGVGGARTRSPPPQQYRQQTNSQQTRQQAVPLRTPLQFLEFINNPDVRGVPVILLFGIDELGAFLTTKFAETEVEEENPESINQFDEAYEHLQNGQPANYDAIELQDEIRRRQLEYQQRVQSNISYNQQHQQPQPPPTQQQIYTEQQRQAQQYQERLQQLQNQQQPQNTLEQMDFLSAQDAAQEGSALQGVQSVAYVPPKLAKEFEQRLRGAPPKPNTLSKLQPRGLLGLKLGGVKPQASPPNKYESDSDRQLRERIERARRG